MFSQLDRRESPRIICPQCGSGEYSPLRGEFKNKCLECLYEYDWKEKKQEVPNNRLK